MLNKMKKNLKRSEIELQSKTLKMENKEMGKMIMLMIVVITTVMMMVMMVTRIIIIIKKTMTELMLKIKKSLNKKNRKIYLT